MVERTEKHKKFNSEKLFDYNYYLLAQYVIAVVSIIIFPDLFGVVMLYEVMLTFAFFLIKYTSEKYIESKSIRVKSISIIALSYIMCFIIMDISNISLEANTELGISLKIVFLLMAFIMNIFIITYYKSLGFNFEKLGFIKLHSKVIINQIIFLALGVVVVYIMLMISKLSFSDIDFTYSKFWVAFIIFGLSREVIFRGALFSYLSKRFSYITSDVKRSVIVVLLNTVIFVFLAGLPSLSDPRFISVLLLSVYGSVCRLRKGHIILPSLVHTMLVLIHSV